MIAQSRKTLLRTVRFGPFDHMHSMCTPAFSPAVVKTASWKNTLS